MSSMTLAVFKIFPDVFPTWQMIVVHVGSGNSCSDQGLRGSTLLADVAKLRIITSAWIQYCTIEGWPPHRRSYGTKPLRDDRTRNG